MNGIDRDFYGLCEEIQSLSELETYYRIRKCFDRVPRETQKSCMDFFNQFGYWGRLEPEKGVYEQIECKAKALHEHIGDFAWLYGRLQDYCSKKTLYAILNNWYRYDFASTAQTREYLFDDYFDLDIVRCTPQEVLVDLGAYTGDTVLSYLKNYGEDCYRKIYCYEITPKSFETLQRNLAKYERVELRRKGVSDAQGTMFLRHSTADASANALDESGGEAVEVTTLDADICEAVTLIKADIEGGEQKAVLGARNHIVSDHPKLLLSVYHNNEDLWKIPRMIDALCSEYAFHLRYRSSPIYPTEITLIAV